MISEYLFLDIIFNFIKLIHENIIILPIGDTPYKEYCSQSKSFCLEPIRLEPIRLEAILPLKK